MNTEKLPKFHRKGMDTHESENTLAEKTDISLIIDKYKEMQAIKESEVVGSVAEIKKPTITQIKAIKKLRHETKIDFSKTIIDEIKTVNEALKPTYGVGIMGKDLKAIQTIDQNDCSQSQISIADSSIGIKTTRDEETGQVKLKALPYTKNPKLTMALTRKDYFENGISAVTTRKVKKHNTKKNANSRVRKSSIASQQDKQKLNNPQIDNSLNLRYALIQIIL
jgi:predicted XRE-type DNA-binding protein